MTHFLSKRKDCANTNSKAVSFSFWGNKNIEKQAEESEEMVQEICRDIKKLDFAKKNLTTTVLSLRRISMLATAVDQLESLVANRQYRDAAGLFQAVGQLNDHLEKFSSISRIVELRNRFKEIKMLFRSHIFEDFATLFAMSAEHNLESGSELKDQYEDACVVIDSMGDEVREELINSVCNRELSQYQKIFAISGDTAKLDRTERRYTWLKKMLRDKQDQLEIFPKKWCVQQRLCTSFCKVTKAQLASILDTSESGESSVDVSALLGALKATLNFEKELENRFGGDPSSRTSALDVDDDDEDGVPESDAAAIRRKYEQKRRERERQLAGDDESVEAFAFKGLISKCFDSHMKPYVFLERKSLMETMFNLIAEETWEVDESDETKVLQSAPQLFQNIKKSLKRCSGLTRGETLIDLMEIFQDVIREYASCLEEKLPKTGSSLSSLQGGDWQVKVTAADESVMCLVVNTANYCFETVGQLLENVERLLGDCEHEMNVEKEEDALSGVMTKALSTLVLGIETNLEVVLKAMIKLDFGAMESVGDQSDFVGVFGNVVNDSVPRISKILGSNDFRFVCDKFGASFPIRYTQNIFKCRRINETGAQQLLLDTHALKTILLELPSMGGQDGTRSSYGKSVNREMAKAEALLKVVQSPPEHAGAMYKALLPEGTVAEFQSVLDLKGLKKAEQQPLLDQLTGDQPARKEGRLASQAAAAMRDGGRSMMLQTSGSFKKLSKSVSKLGNIGSSNSSSSGGNGDESNANGSSMRKNFDKFSKQSTQSFRNFGNLFTNKS